MTDFLIAGAGINGLLVARELLRSGATVILLDRGACGQEASWAGGGIVSPLYPWRYSQPVTALASWAQEFYPHLARELLESTGIDPELEAGGLLMLDAEDKDHALAWAARHGRRMEPVERKFIYCQEPRIGPHFDQGLWMPDVSSVRNPRLIKALVAELVNSPGLALMEQCQVVGINVRGGRVSSFNMLSAGKAARLEARSYVLCTGAWSGLLIDQLNLSLPVEPVKGQMILYRLPEPPLNGIVLSGGRYLIPRRDGHLLAGSTLEYCGFDKTPSHQALLDLQRSAQAILPCLAEQQPVGHWAGLRPGAPGGVPFIGHVPGIDNLFINAGQFRNGLVLAPASARLTADLLLGRQPIVDPEPYLLSRRIST